MPFEVARLHTGRTQFGNYFRTALDHPYGHLVLTEWYLPDTSCGE
jgi:hypothetical protein